jgi:hypothetical protein
MGMAAYLPPGWPAGVHPPGSEDFERTAVAWLLDVVPPDYRLYGVLRRHPIALAAMASHHVAACVEGARQGYRTARSELGEALPPHGIDSVLVAYRSEGHRLVATAQAVDLVARALRGEVFRPQIRAGRLEDGKASRPKPGRPEEPEGPKNSEGSKNRKARRTGSTSEPRGAAPPGLRSEERATREGGALRRPGVRAGEQSPSEPRGAAPPGLRSRA